MVLLNINGAITRDCRKGWPWVHLHAKIGLSPQVSSGMMSVSILPNSPVTLSGSYRRMRLSSVLPLLLTVLAAKAAPCDIFEAANTPCVAAHSMTRALYTAYDGVLYRIQRTVDGAELDIGVLRTGGTANSTAQDKFCAHSGCTVRKIYDQSPQGNHLDTAPGGPWYAPHPDSGVNASRSQHSVGGRAVYGAAFEGKQGYRNDNTSGVATGDEPETIYMVVDGTDFNDKCCCG
jgi:hypothetical protein